MAQRTVRPNATRGTACAVLLLLPLLQAGWRLPTLLDCSFLSLLRCPHGNLGGGNNPRSHSLLALWAKKPQNLDVSDHGGISLLIDADAVGKSHWAPIVEALRVRGYRLQSADAFGPPNSNMEQSAVALGIQYYAVPRRKGGTKDPNDIAVAMHAGRLACARRNSSLALATSDLDFLYVVGCLRSWGHRVAVLLPAGRNLQVIKEFADAGAEVIFYELGRLQLPTLKAVLHSNGTTTFTPLTRLEQANLGPADNATLSSLFALMAHLGFVSKSKDLTPALAKFLFAHGINKITVFPVSLLYIQAVECLHELGRDSLIASRGNLIYIVPINNTKSASQMSKEARERFGSVSCERMFLAGGPFMLSDSEHAVPDVLRRLGYLNDDMNTDLNEAIDIFGAVGLNRQKLLSTGVDIGTEEGLEGKCNALRQALISQHEWKTAPKDTAVRTFLADQKYLADSRASAVKVRAAMLAYATTHGLPTGNNYQSLVAAVDAHRTRMDPNRRT